MLIKLHTSKIIHAWYKKFFRVVVENFCHREEINFFDIECISASVQESGFQFKAVLVVASSVVGSNKVLFIGQIWAAKLSV